MTDFSRRAAIKLGAGALAATSLPSFGRAKGSTGTNNIGLALIPFTIAGPTPYFGIPQDQYSNGIAGALQASICRSTLAFYPEFPVPQTERNLYYTKQPVFEYARILHKYALDNHCFAFQLDEISQDAGPLNQVWNPTSLAVTIHGLT